MQETRFYIVLRWKGGIILWEIKHRRLIVRVYTYASLAWLALLVLTFTASPSIEPSQMLPSLILVILLLWGPMLIPLYIIRRVERKAPPCVPDPYLSSALEKLRAIERYLRGRCRSRGAPS